MKISFIPLLLCLTPLLINSCGAQEEATPQGEDSLTKESKFEKSLKEFQDDVTQFLKTSEEKFKFLANTFEGVEDDYGLS